MTLARTADIIESAKVRGRAALALNIVTLEQAEGIVMGAESAGVPVILQLSENAVRYHRGQLRPLAAAAAEVAKAAGVDVSLHLDHVTDHTLWESAADAALSSVMVDASTLPHDENVAVTAAATKLLQGQGLHVEAELGEIGGKDGAHAPGVRTDPGEAAAYVEATGVDALAVAVGSSHAMTTQTATLDLDLIGRLRDAVPVPLVLHGSSGVPMQTLRDAVAAGMVKINVGTLLGQSMTAGVRAYLEANPSTVDPRKYLSVGRDKVAEAVETLARELG